MTVTDERADLERAAAFHGHLCAGVALGVRAAHLALRELGPNEAGNRLYAVVETAMCAVDGIQVVTGCTLGRGTLVHLDHGKNIFTFARRADGRALRLAARREGWPRDTEERKALQGRLETGGATPEEHARYWALMEERALALMDVPEERLFEVREVEAPPLAGPRPMGQARCDSCGETVLASHLRRVGERGLCAPCAARAEGA
ncbi:MAG TPA: FmdE family protein [Chloroflexaceae bacterium]|nr:FmdE family protein [Chloroflexaceae bacterium]